MGNETGKVFGLVDAIRTMVPTRAPYEGVCGETFDHDTFTTFEDDEVYQWECSNCGAEGWEDLKA